MARRKVDLGDENDEPVLRCAYPGLAITVLFESIIILSVGFYSFVDESTVFDTQAANVAYVFHFYVNSPFGPH